MTVDPGLEVAVDAFVEAVTAALLTATEPLPDAEPDALRRSVLTEAFDLSCAFIDADQRASDDELWVLIATFGPRLHSDLRIATPDDLRHERTTDGTRKWLASTSDLFEILVGTDRRHGSDLAVTYYEHAMTLAHTVASLDEHTGRDELLALDRFRALLLQAIKSDGEKAAATSTASDDTTTPTSPADPADPADPAPRSLDDLLAELDSLVGLSEVKREVRLVADLLAVQRLRHQRHLPVVESSRHLVFTGNPGTGKTTVARLLAQIYRTLGVVGRGHLVESDRAGLVAGYVGQTAAKVTAVFDQADGGVLLIDEAYALVRGSESDFGREAIDTIVKLVEDRRDRLVVIAAGYPDEMGDFLAANPGLPSRFPRTIAFPDYSDDELVEIFEGLCRDGGYQCGPDSRSAIRVSLGASPRGKGFGNGRTARNLFERAIERQASRVVDIDQPTDEDLCTLTAPDLTEVGLTEVGLTEGDLTRADKP
jgi:energy-coupling factor transporter ATP-binding protein EcfA2